MATTGGPVPVASLIEEALGDPDYDGTIRWQVIAALHERRDLETFTAARRLCGGGTVTERMLGVDILGGLGFTDRSLPVLRYLAASEDDPMVLYSVLIAFGHLRDRRALPSVIPLTGHPDAAVRYGAAYALPNIVGDPPDPAGMDALRRLTRDPDDDVADWACLGTALVTGSAGRTAPGRLTPGGEVQDVGREVLDP
ncbi:HEAT repeat domain-containing protein [Planobispora rosea]|uniref:HEAT repeat domain-containing protein n=1 Tax=Planobispora rosea TaxID=35762 RepID=UPI00083A03D4|nr:HEAT repeat domain-containing protein [Planobispora rosea]